MTLGDPFFEDKRSILPPKLKKPLLITACVVAMVAIGMVAGSIIASSTLSVRVPDEIAAQARSSVYMPGWLPSGYSVDQSSFTFSEDTVVFSAINPSGSRLIFAEQARPQDFDFDDFHNVQLQEPKVIDGSKYTSVWGKATDGRLLLSVVTDETWIIMTTGALLSQEDLTRIVNGLKK